MSRSLDRLKVLKCRRRKVQASSSSKARKIDLAQATNDVQIHPLNQPHMFPEKLLFLITLRHFPHSKPTIYRHADSNCTSRQLNTQVTAQFLSTQPNPILLPSRSKVYHYCAALKLSIRKMASGIKAQNKRAEKEAAEAALAQKRGPGEMAVT